MFKKSIQRRSLAITSYLCIISGFVFLILILNPSLVTASDFRAGLNETAAGTGHTASDIPATIGKVVGAALAFVGVVFLILMIYGGFLWMLARGNETEVTKAKDTIIAAIIGLIIVLSAYAITSYIGTALQ